MDEPDPRKRQLETLLLESRSVRDHLDDVVLRAGRHLGTDTEVSISLRHRGHDRLAATTSERAGRCDTVEHEAGSGPCVSAMDRLQVVLVPDISQEVRWPSWREAAVAAGYRAAAGVPAHVADGAEIALDLYSERLDPWDGPTLLRADGLAQDVARTVRLCLELARLDEQAARAERLLDAQAAFDRAVRLTMTSQGVTAPRALELLLEATAARRRLEAERAGAPGSPDEPAPPPEDPER